MLAASDHVFAVLVLQVGDAMPPIDDATFAEVCGTLAGNWSVGTADLYVLAKLCPGPGRNLLSATAAAKHKIQVYDVAVAVLFSASSSTMQAVQHLQIAVSELRGSCVTSYSFCCVRTAAMPHCA
jgi:hypothetical protein